MEEPILNAHNKEEYPPMHTEETNTPLINFTTKLLIHIHLCDYNQ